MISGQICVEIKMERAQKLREKADRCIRLARGVSSPADFALLSAIAAEAEKAAEEIELAEAARCGNDKGGGLGGGGSAHP